MHPQVSEASLASRDGVEQSPAKVPSATTTGVEIPSKVIGGEYILKYQVDDEVWIRRISRVVVTEGPGASLGKAQCPSSVKWRVALPTPKIPHEQASCWVSK